MSSRHVSFLETGRARPSREMVLRLADHLDIPLRERNRLLLAAGYAPLYAERSLEEPEMAPVHQALDRFLRAHEPYPAVVIDRHYNLVSANDAVSAPARGRGAGRCSSRRPTRCGSRFTRDGMAPRTLNLGEWSAHLLHRLRREAALTADPELERLHDELAGYPGVCLEAPREEGAAGDIVVPLRLRTADRELAFFSTISTFGSPVDITLDELMIEAFYPANAATAVPPAAGDRGSRAGRRSPLRKLNCSGNRARLRPAPAPRHPRAARCRTSFIRGICSSASPRSRRSSRWSRSRSARCPGSTRCATGWGTPTRSGSSRVARRRARVLRRLPAGVPLRRSARRCRGG